MKRVIKSNTSVTADKKFYFGMEASAKYGNLIAEKLAGKSISKRRDKGEQPGGLVYEANKLGIDMWDLLEALEGMCYEGRAQEIDDSTYRVKGSVGAITQSQNESTHEVYYIQDGRECVEFDGTEDECNEYIDEITPEQEDEYGDEYPERYVRRKTKKSRITSSTARSDVATHEVYYVKNGLVCVEFEGTEDECREYRSTINSEQPKDEELGIYLRRFMRSKRNK